jgi:hypothetical protein
VQAVVRSEVLEVVVIRESILSEQERRGDGRGEWSDEERDR